MALVLAARCKTRARHLDLHHASEQPPATKRNAAKQQRCLFTTRLAAHGHQQCQPEHCSGEARARIKFSFSFGAFDRFSTPPRELRFLPEVKASISAPIFNELLALRRRWASWASPPMICTRGWSMNCIGHIYCGGIRASERSGTFGDRTFTRGRVRSWEIYFASCSILGVFIYLIN